LLKASQFKDTTRMKRLLRYLVEETLEGRGTRLKGYSIGLEVFDRPDDFDPQADTIVRVQAGQLRRRLDLYYSQEGRDSPIRLVVPKGTYRPRFEFRSAQTHIEQPTAVEPEGTRFATRASRMPSGRPGVIVLTFSDLSLSESRDYFAEGLTAEVVNALVQFRYLRVVTRTATVSSLGPEVGVGELAKRHNVDFVLTGSIRQSGENVRVSVNLIDANTGLHIYSKIFDRRYTPRNMFDIQDEIASYVAASVAAPYGAITRFHRQAIPDMELSTYEVILRFYEMNISPSRNKARQLREDVEKVIQATPDYSVPWAIKSLLDSFMVGQTLNMAHAQEYVQSAIKSADRAVRLNSDNSIGFLALLLARFYNHDLPAYEAAAERCVTLNPNDASAMVYLACTQAFLGDLKDAHALHARAIELLPRPPRWFSVIPAMEMLLAGQHDYVLNTIGTVSSSRGIWSQMLTLAAIGNLDRPQVGHQLLGKLRELHPNYDQEIKAAFLRWNPHDALQDVTFTGWEKAGVKL
jgi:TolB-like protein